MVEIWSQWWGDYSHVYIYIYNHIFSYFVRYMIIYDPTLWWRRYHEYWILNIGTSIREYIPLISGIPNEYSSPKSFASQGLTCANACAWAGLPSSRTVVIVWAFWMPLAQRCMSWDVWVHQFMEHGFMHAYRRPHTHRCIYIYIYLYVYVYIYIYT